MLYTYDGFNKLTETVKPDGKWLHNEYSAEGFRISTEENGFRYDFVFDRGNIKTELNANTQQVTRGIRGIGLIGQKDNKGNLNYYLNNAHGDIVSLVNSEGQVLNSYEYDAFGNTTNYAEKVANRFMYAGEQFDSITGQYYLRARYYNPVIGRFTQEDTYRGDGLNLYAYVANNPLKYVDPSGYCKDYSDIAVYYSQYDTDWKDDPYVDPRNPDGDTIGSAGCGPTAVAMAISTLTGKSITPDIIAEYSKKKDYKDKDKGTKSGLYISAPKAYGLSVTTTMNTETVKNDIRNGSVAIVSMGTGHFTGGGHIMMIAGIITENGKDRYVIYDPNLNNKYYKNYKGSEITKTDTPGIIIVDCDFIEKEKSKSVSNYYVISN